MYKLHYLINSIPQVPIQYHDRNDALRRANQIWPLRHQMCRALGVDTNRCHVEFMIVGEDGSMLEHAAIMDEIDKRPDLKKPPKVY